MMIIHSAYLSSHFYRHKPETLHTDIPRQLILFLRYPMLIGEENICVPA